jgi:hypothetical protein
MSPRLVVGRRGAADYDHVDGLLPIHIYTIEKQQGEVTRKEEGQVIASETVWPKTVSPVKQRLFRQ